MVTVLYRYLAYIGVIAISAVLLYGYAYNKGYKTAENRYQKEKLELIIKKEREKDEIMAKIREKSPIERRKELNRYVIK